MADPYRFFRIEAAELTNALEAGLLELDRGDRPPQAALSSVLRHAHTLKGAARVVRHETSASLAHALEELLVPVREAGVPLTPDLVSRALVMVDTLRSTLAELSQPSASEEQQAPSGAASAPAVGTNSVRAKTGAADAGAEQEPLLATRPGGEALADRETIGRLLEHATALGAELAHLEGTRARLGRLRRRLGSGSGVDARLAGSLALAASPERDAEPWLDELAQADRELAALTQVTARQLRELQGGLERLRLVASDDLRGPLNRTIRDAALTVGKRVRFEFHGGGLRIEPQLHAAVSRALLQVVKNGVVHGIEAPEAREKLGKPPEGRISVTVLGRGSTIVFSCEDDGAGLNLDALRAVMAARSPAGSPVPSDSALVEALLSGGVSTAPRVTAVAGRGIGLDLVRDAVESVQATLHLENRPGQGVKLAIVAKAEIAAFPALLVEAEGLLYALPLDAVWRTAQGQIDGSSLGGPGILVDGRLIPFCPLTSLVAPDGAQPRTRATWTVAITRDKDDLLAVGVDRLLGTESVVSHPVPEAARVNPALAGVSAGPGGTLRFLLDTTWLHGAARGFAGSVSTRIAPTPLILIIDDSLTTRMLERSILESAGYQVDMATSAEEGLEMARTKRYALFLVDVEMPGMDGFTFIETTQADPELCSVPAILVTSRNSPEDLARGARVGARGHVVKSEFDQVELLSRIERLVQHA